MLKEYEIINEKDVNLVLTSNLVPDKCVHLTINAPITTQISGSLFERYDDLKKVDLSKCISLRKIGYWLFTEARNLEEILLAKECKKHMPLHTFNEKIRSKIKFANGEKE